MLGKSEIVPYKPEFPGLLEDYLKQIKDSIKRNLHHDHRRHLFVDFLRKGFDIDPLEIELEKKIQVTKIRGYIDAFFKTTIFEFKCDCIRSALLRN